MPSSLILLDLGYRMRKALEAVRRAHAAAPHAPLVVLTGSDDESLALQTLQEGAQDYLIKGQIDPRGLLRALRYAAERKLMEDALFVGDGARPSHPQLDRRRRYLLGHCRECHFPQYRGGGADGLVVVAGERAGP